jgi:hypothetical protein
MHIPLEGITLSCDKADVSIENVKFVVAKKLWLSNNGLKEMAVASVNSADAKIMTEFPDLHSKLKTAFDNDKCGLAKTNAAAQMRLHLPLRYSDMLRNAYNHQVWPKATRGNIQDVTRWVSLDLQPGMRLRIENSVPIAPAGINSSGGHPSSFAAPTYLYFHSLMGFELCGGGAKVSDIPFYCNKSIFPSQKDLFVSATAELARLGLFQGFSATDTKRSVWNQQVRDPCKECYCLDPKPSLNEQREPDGITNNRCSVPTQQARDSGKECYCVVRETSQDMSRQKAQRASGLIDLQEVPSVGIGAWKFWRLWMPAMRKTEPYTAFTEPGGVGAEESVNSAPMLMAANIHTDLGDLPDKGGPCESDQNVSWRCSSLHFRVVPVPEITVMIKGTPTWVSLGTTLREMLEHRWQDLFVFETLEGAESRRIEAQRKVLAEVELLRRHRGALHPVKPFSLKEDEEVGAFLRIQLLPGDEIKWP